MFLVTHRKGDAKAYTNTQQHHRRPSPGRIRHAPPRRGTQPTEHSQDV